MKIISVDFQKDFTEKEGICYEQRESVDFIKSTLAPYLRKHSIKIAEIISDYRQPRFGDRGDLCHPGERGYDSEVPQDVKLNNTWIKCMNSPIWLRENIGVANKKPGLPYQNPELFNKWLEQAVGKPKDAEEIILIGLTLDCCVLSLAQELNWHGYKVRILEEAVDTYSGNPQEKKQILNNVPLKNWAKPISWKQFKDKYK
ncbi:isochorismatase family protein [Candidatus Pacearchaeota archaeon]|nr:isochorismatase family protein [Candidatus Pacearchaeota archaeon]